MKTQRIQVQQSAGLKQARAKAMSVVRALDTATNKQGEVSVSTALEGEGLDALAGMFHPGRGGIVDQGGRKPRNEAKTEGEAKAKAQAKA